MEPDGGTDKIKDRGRVCIYGGAGNVLVPQIVRRERNETIQAGALSEGRPRTARGLCGTVDLQIDQRRLGAARIRILHENGIGACGSDITVAVSFVEETNVVERIVPPTWTCAPATNSLPVSVSV